MEVEIFFVGIATIIVGSVFSLTILRTIVDMWNGTPINKWGIVKASKELWSYWHGRYRY